MIQTKKERYKKIAECVRNYRKNNPLANKARIIVFSKKRNGTLIQKPCMVCGNKKSEAHHEDYTKPLKIKWLCKKHHVEADCKRRKKEERIKQNERSIAYLRLSPYL